MSTLDIDARLKDVPDKYLVIIARIIAGYENDTTGFEQFNDPILKPSIRSIYMLFVIQYGVLSIVGIVMNIAIITYALVHRLYKDVTHAFIINLALCYFIQCSIVLPISLMVLLVQNWMFGQFLCFFLPILQDIPFHVAIISHLLIAWDRMRWLGDPLRGRLPAFVCCCATWLTGMVIALPYPIYTTFLDLGSYVEGLNGVGLCFVNLIDDMQEYMRGLFVILYCAPTTILAYLYIKTSQELRPPDGPFAVMMFEHRADIRNKQRNSNTSSTTERPDRHNSSRSYDLYNAELDVTREKQMQRHLGSMAATQVLCTCPLMILRLAKMVLTETYENARHFDFTYLTFVWMAFLPTVIFPFIYACGILSRSAKERLRGYFRLSMRKRDSSKPQDEPDQSTMQRYNSAPRDMMIQNEEIENVNIVTNVRHPVTERTIKSNTRHIKNYFQSAGNTNPMNNSSSNITSSTYCNNGRDAGSGIGFESTSVVSGDKDSLFEGKWVNSMTSLALCQKDMTISDCESIVRHDSSSTLERDLEIIDLLERERSMDMQDIMKQEHARGFIRNFERRKLPDLEKICKSPKNSIQSNEIILENSLQYPSRKSSHSSYGRRGSILRESNSVESECGVFSDRADSVNKPVIMESRIKRTKHNSSSSTRSSNKSQGYVVSNVAVGIRDNVSSNL